MLSPRSLLVFRQNQNHRASSSLSASTSSTLACPPLSPATSTTSACRKDDRLASQPFRNTLTDATTTADKMTVTSRQSVRSTYDSALPGPPSLPPTEDTRPTTPTSPVQIPNKSKNKAISHRNHRDHDERRHRSNSPRWRNVPSPDAVPASVAALLAVTTIPPPRRGLRRSSTREQDKRMTVESILQGQTSEKELSFNFTRGPMDVLLSPPEDLEDDDLSIGDSMIASPISIRSLSCDSVPSLADSISTETISSVDSPRSASRGRRVQPTRKSLTPVSSPAGEREEHPLYRHEVDVEELDFTIFAPASEGEEKKGRIGMFRSAFKSNLTASLRALRNAARSFSAMNMPSIPPEDFLTRSILTLEPNVPFTDERMPPALEEEPSAAVRRYLNPTQTSRLESQASSSMTNPRGSFTASIQMQTYKVQRSKMTSSGTRGSRSYGDQSARGKETVFSFPPGPRQREMRENSDFIRIAVMEMSMRKNGKLDEQRPGRARWALPPRKTSTKPYEIGTDGVPARWVAVTP